MAPIYLGKRVVPSSLRYIENLAIDSISVTVMSRRLSFFDKMSAFGNVVKQKSIYIVLS